MLKSFLDYCWRSPPRQMSTKPDGSVEEPVSEAGSATKKCKKPSDLQKPRRRPDRGVVLPFQLIEGEAIKPVGTVHSVGPTRFVCSDERPSPSKRKRIAENSLVVSVPAAVGEFSPQISETPTVSSHTPFSIPTENTNLNSAIILNEHPHNWGSRKPTLDINVRSIMSEEAPSPSIDEDFVQKKSAETAENAMSPPVMEMTTHGSIAPPVGEENHGGNPPPPVPAFNETSSLDMKVEFMRPEDHPEDLTDISVLQGEISEVLAWRRSSNDPDQKPHFLVRMSDSNHLVIVPIEFFHWNERHKRKLLNFLGDIGPMANGKSD